VAPAKAEQVVDVSIVLPCLNEIQSLEPCVRGAQQALADLRRLHGLRGEVIVADNGSTDGSQALAMRLGARVVPVSERGYGAALRGGFNAARGRYLVMGDADGSYNFREAVPMVEQLMDGADLCMGSRFKGGIEPGAMPWKNRYIGNPLLTGILNLLFRTGIEDAHCGLRALTKACFERLALTGSGMEFASEMVIKASLKRQVIREVPATLSRDTRDRPPHLRPWRDGWRHLRYLFMLSPLWLFALPAVAGGLTASFILGAATLTAIRHPGQPSYFGNYWVVLAGAMMSVSQIAAILAGATHLYGVRAGFRPGKAWVNRLSRWLTLESMAGSGVVSALLGLAILVWAVMAWSGRGFGPNNTVLPVVLGTMFVALGAQNVLGGFMLSVIGGNEARFLDYGSSEEVDAEQETPPPARLVAR